MPEATRIRATDNAFGPLLGHGLDQQAKYERGTPSASRKEKGQFFTPPEVCQFMAGLLSLDRPNTFRLLDPGAGAGSLSAAVCDRFLKLRRSRRVEIHLFENDAEVLPSLEKTMRNCAENLQRHGHSLSYVVHNEDFILDAASTVFGPPSLFGDPPDRTGFDAVIMNPPYFKVRKGSRYARIMDDIVHGQPNIYAFFLAAAAQMLVSGGQMVAITPRSFCNGLYFRGFRHWFLQRMSLDHIHLFESRTEAFRDVLQESLITASHRLGAPSTRVRITTSYGRDLRQCKEQALPISAVVDDSCGHATVRIPATQEDLTIAGIVESWPHRFSETGLRVSTGPVVRFRATAFLLPRLNGADSVPLLSVFNVKAYKTEWPILGKKHPTAFKVCADSLRLLLPIQNYVLLRRFSAKEERRRLTASCLLATDVKQPYVALENHLNYVYHAERQLSTDETYGLAALFNSSLLDRYFRTISGNTQVNATELRTMKFPCLAVVAAIGQEVRALATLDRDRAELIVLEQLGVNGEIRRHLLEGTLSSQI